MRLIESQIKGVKKGNSRCPFNRDVHLIESQINGVKKGRDQRFKHILFHYIETTRFDFGLIR